MATQLRNKKRLGSLVDSVLKEIKPIKNTQFTNNSQPFSPNMGKKTKHQQAVQRGQTTQLRKQDPTYQPPVKITPGAYIGGQGVNIQGATQLRSKNNQLVPMNKPLNAGLKAAQAARQLKAMNKEKRQNTLRGARTVKGLLNTAAGQGNMRQPSSNVESVTYDGYLDDLYVEFKKGSMYKYAHIGVRLATIVLNGLEWCRTDDPTGLNRWRKYKNPSIGAAVYWNLVRPHVPFKLMYAYTGK